MEHASISLHVRTDHIGNVGIYFSLLYLGAAVCVLGAVTLRGNGMLLGVLITLT